MPDDPRVCIAPCPRTTARAESILSILSLAGRQLRTGGMDGTILGLDWNVVARLADDAGIETDTAWWTLVSFAESELVEAVRPPKDPKAPPAVG